MGSSSSRVAKTASSTARRYPTSPSIPKPTTARSANAPPSQPSTYESQPGPTVHPKPSASTSRDQSIDLDARDPDFGSRLSRLGPVDPHPTYSHSSTFSPKPQVVKSSSSSKSAEAPPSGTHVFPSASSNPALLIVQARERLAKVFEEESENLGRGSFQGKTLINAGELKNMLSMRDEARRPLGEIEKQLSLRQGVVGKLGQVGVVGNA
jgi:hypothetical protein